MTALAYLSMQRVTGRQPVVYTNTQRMQAHRAIAPVEFANNHFPKESPVHNPTPSGRAAPSYDHGGPRPVIQSYALRRGE